MSCTDFPCQ